MDNSLIAKIARRLMRQPAVPYHEGMVIQEIIKIGQDYGLSVRADQFGNLIVKFQRGKQVRPIVMVSHMDHPGFEVQNTLSPSRWKVRFLGGVSKEYFKVGAKLRLFPGNKRAEISKSIGLKKEYEIRALEGVSQEPRFAVWDLEAFGTRKGHIQGRACDDLIGVTAILVTLIQLKQSRVHGHAIGLITRAEEVGFHGALAAASQGNVPRRSVVLSLETSKEMPPVKMGQGVVVRVGDRTSIFDSKITQFLTSVAAEILKTESGFQYQRALMSGGSCEATGFQEYQYTTAALCVALGNYHNCGPRSQIAAEFVSIDDVTSMVKLLYAAIVRMKNFRHYVDELPRKLDRISTDAKPRLIATKP